MSLPWLQAICEQKSADDGECPENWKSWGPGCPALVGLGFGVLGFRVYLGFRDLGV